MALPIDQKLAFLSKLDEAARTGKPPAEAELARKFDTELARRTLCAGKRHESERETESGTVKDGPAPQARAALKLVNAYVSLNGQEPKTRGKRRWLREKVVACEAAMRQVVFGGVQPAAALAAFKLKP